MSEKPVKVSDDLDDEDERPEWTETNEPELAERIAEDWDNLQVGGVVILCGTYDDEYGWLWNATDGEWESYMY